MTEPTAQNNAVDILEVSTPTLPDPEVVPQDEEHAVEQQEHSDAEKAPSFHASPSPLEIDTAAANDLEVSTLNNHKSPPLGSPLSFKQHESSPQPWDLVDPPQSNNKRLDPNMYHTVIGQQIVARPRIPKSSYYFGPPGPGSSYFGAPVGHIGIHYPREVLRVERDYSGGELCQFAAIYPLELEGRITPTQFIESINSINEVLISAHSSGYALLDNALQILSLQLSRMVLSTHYHREMNRLKVLFDDLNHQLYHPVGLHMVWPRKFAFLFMEIEYY